MSNPNLYASQPFGSGSGSNTAGINPAMLAAGFQNGPLGPQQQQKFPQNVFGGGAVNPAQLMGASSIGMNMNPSSVSPAQLLQQQQQQQQHGMMNGTMNGMNLMTMNPAAMSMNPMASMNPGGINPATFSQSSNPGFNSMIQSQQHPSLHQAPQAQLHQQHQQHQQQPQQHPLMSQQQMLLNALGLTREQFSALSQQEKQQAWMKVFPMQFGNNSNSNLTPGGLQHHPMMPPPAPPQSQGGSISVPGRPPTSQGQQRMLMAQAQQRPPTAQGQQGQQRPSTAQGMQIHRPSTAQGHRGASGPGSGSTPQTPNLASANLSVGMAQMQRPPTAQDQRHGGPGGQQTRPPTAQGMPQTHIHPNHSQPGTRPPFTQSGVIGQQISRPGTALSHRSPVSASGSANVQSPGVRPPSRVGSEQQVCPFLIHIR